MKKVLSILFSVLLVFSIGTSAFAAVKTNDAKAQEIVDSANSQIQEKIDQAIAQATEVKAKYAADVAKENDPSKIAKLDQKYNDDLNRIFNQILYTQTYSISTWAIDQAAKNGVTVERYWTTITFAGAEYLIDPVRVVGYGEDPQNSAE